VGSTLPEFTSATVEGAVVSQQTLASGRAVVAFLQPGCGPCQELVPDVLRYAEKLPDGQARVLAVVVDGPDGSGDLAEALGQVADVVAGPPAAAMVDALAVRGFPTVYSLEDGTVRWAGPRLPRLDGDQRENGRDRQSVDT
jgi:thiol-disulfide isomerase/thioredoxin